MSNFVRDITTFDIDDLTRRFRRHTFFIRSLKFIFPVAAILMIAMLIIFPNLGNKSKKILIEPIVVSEKEEIPAMINPRFNGFDADNQPYNISAVRAYQIEEKTVLLQEINADISMADGTWASIITPEGIYKIKEKHLSLAKEFEIFITSEDGSNINIAGSGIDLDLNTEVIKSAGAIRAESPMGQLTAKGFTINKKEGIIRFGGRVKLLVKR